MPALTSPHKPIIHTALHKEAIGLLKQLIAIPSFSREEDWTAEAIAGFLSGHGISCERKQNNILARNKFYDPSKPTLLLNSHHDTVKPNSGYTLDPFEAIEKDGKLFGLGSNDAGGPLVALIMVFIYFYGRSNLNYNLVLAATAEEEISGKSGIESVLGDLGPVDAAIVGEPTGMRLAVSEKGLLVIDCLTLGTSSHAAHSNPDNAIYNAMKDLEWFKTFRFPKKSATLGEVSMNVTLIKAGSQHNVIPGSCEFTVDIRTTDAYTHAELLEIIGRHVSCAVQPRSLRLKSSSIPLEHPIVKAGTALGLELYGSPTISDRALMNFPSVKIGPGDSLRSHSSDEFIFVAEIENGIDIYIHLLSSILEHE